MSATHTTNSGYPIGATLSHLLGGSAVVELLSIEAPIASGIYQPGGFKTISRWLMNTVTTAPEPGPHEPRGFPAISRWLSAATPPVHRVIHLGIPEGCQPCPARTNRTDEHVKQMGAIWK